MTNEEILVNAPEGATHYCKIHGYVLSAKGGFMSYDKDADCWDYEYANISDVRSLDDIRRIVELEQALNEALSAIGFLPKIKADAVRLAIEECAWQGGEIYVSDLHLFANKLERGEV